MRERRLSVLRDRCVERVLDVGANQGQYGLALRADGYGGEIVSFEPGRDAFQRLERYAAADGNWQARHVALGEREARTALNLSANSYSSSLLPITRACTEAAPEAAYIGSEPISMTTLDGLGLPAAVTYLKIDVQGYEPQVLAGATELLGQVVAVELELSLVPLYEGQALADEVCTWLRRRSLVPVAFQTAFAHPATGEILQVDGLFARLP